MKKWLLGIGLCLFIVTGIIWLRSHRSTELVSPKFKTKRLIEHGVKFDITPQITKTTIQMSINIECYNNPKMLQINFVNASFITIEGTPIVPIHWNQTFEGDYKRTGILTFPKTTSTPPQSMTLHIYGLETYEFIWDHLSPPS